MASPLASPLASIDLAGEVCPYTFLKTKLALEELPVGAELRVRVDHPPAAKSVPRSCQELGHEVVSVREDQGSWEIVIRKRV